MLIPINSDAPLYHLPIATICLVMVNCAFSIFMWDVEPETFEVWILQYGDGFHPLQWVTSNFMHGDYGHLIGNMVFLLPFGLLVEGKIGWWKFLLLYLGIGISQACLQQLFMLGEEYVPGSLGASAAIFGIVVVTVLWAPKNDMTCLLFIFPIVRTLDIPITVLVGFYLGWEVFMFTLDGFSIQTAALHLLGAIMGGVAGILFLKFRWVDCEGWDLLSVMAGNHAAAKATRKNVNKPDLKKKLAAEQTQRNVAVKKRQEAAELIQKLLQEGQLVPAFNFYSKLTATLGELPLSAPALLQLGKGLLDAERVNDCITVWLAYLKVETAPAIKVRLKLAQLLIDNASRPATALEILSGIPADPLPPELEKFRGQLTAKAEMQMENAELELE